MRNDTSQDDLKDYCLSSSNSLLEAVQLLSRLQEKILLVVDEDRKLLGTIVDGDIRRAILKGCTQETPLAAFMHTTPVTLKSNDDMVLLYAKFDPVIKHIPVLDEEGRVVALRHLQCLARKSSHPNPVLLMAGGLGTRLGDLTKHCPKPLLAIRQKPILEHILEKFVAQGFQTFFFSVNYKAEMIERYFGDGSRWNVHISYLRERRRMGTAGALSLLPKGLETPVIVMNGDILTAVNFSDLLDFHASNNASVTSAVTLYQQQVPFGVIDVSDNRITGLREKPTFSYFVNAGIYVIDPDRLADVPCDVFFDMPELLQMGIDRGDLPGVFPLHEYWLDVGRPEDFEKAVVYTFERV